MDMDGHADVLGPRKPRPSLGSRTSVPHRGTNVSTSKFQGSSTAELGHRALRDLADLRRLVLVEAARSDQRIDLRDRELRHRCRSRRPLQQLDRRGEADFVARADRDDTGDQLLEDRRRRPR